MTTTDAHAAEQRARVEAEKAAYVRAPRSEQTVPNAVLTNPELYEAGPGPHLERYGGRSGALPAAARPEDARVTTVLESEGAYPKLYVWVPSFRCSVGELVAISAQVLDEGGKPVAAHEASLTILEKSSQTAFQAVMEGSGSGAYVHHFRPLAVDTPLASYDYVVFALVDTDRGQELRTAQGAFQVHAAVARVLAAEAKVAPVSGDLRLELPVLIDSPGDYTFYAELWGGEQGGVAVAFAAEHRARVSRGRQVVELTFGGLVIKDRKLDGPFVVRNIRVRRVSDYPFIEADPIEALPPTPAWVADSFG